MRNENRAILKCMSVVAAMLAVSARAQGQATYDTEFTVDNGLSPTYASGDFSANFEGVSLQYSGPFPVDGANIFNTGPGTLSLTFSEPVTSISFDIGGLDASWGDEVIFSQVPAIGLAQSSISSVYDQNSLILSGDTIVPSGDGSGGRVTFSDLPDVTYFAWTDAGTAGAYDFTFYDNFAFTTSDVPEPSTLVLAGLGCLSLIAYGRKLKKYVRNPR
jgi:hypothetical protein